MRKKTLIIMGVIAVVYLILWGVMVNTFMGVHDDTLGSLAAYFATQAGLSFSSLIVALLAVMLGAGVLSGDIQSGLALSILTRPIRRYEYILGKLAGLCVLVCTFATLMFFSLIVIGAALDLPTLTHLSPGQTLSAWLCYLLVPVSLLILTLFLSLPFKSVSNGIVAIFIYILGDIGGIVEQIGQWLQDPAVSDTVAATGVFMSLLSPFHTLYTTAESLLLPSSAITELSSRFMGSSFSASGAPPSVLMYVYIALYVSTFLALTVRLFSRKDIA